MLKDIRTIFSLAVLFVAPLSAPGALWADRVILNDGTVYVGRVITDLAGSVLLTDRPGGAPPLILKKENIRLIAHEAMPPRLPPNRYPFAAVSTGIGGATFPARALSLDPAAGLLARVSGRLHALAQIDGFLEWVPAISGQLSISDPMTVRGYEKFYAYTGGVQFRLFPWRGRVPWDPYLLGGYALSSLVPKGSGDRLEGQGWRAGLGVSRRISARLLFDAEFVYQALQYHRVQFLGSSGFFADPVNNPTCTLTTTLGWIL